MANELVTPPPVGDESDFCADRGRLYRLLKQGHLEPKRGGVMANVLGTLAKSLEAADISQFSDEEILAELRRRDGVDGDAADH
jgi:hypothetical protein